MTDIQNVNKIANNYIAIQNKNIKNQQKKEKHKTEHTIK